MAIAGVALFVCLPVLLFGFPNGHDAKLHEVWHLSFADQLWSGELYPRWVSEAMWGLGGPVFFYYPPVGFYASGLISLFTGGDPLGRYALGAASTLALALSGCAAYLWLRTMVGTRAALAGAVMYMVVPYHLVLDLYLRTAYAEFWAFVWMPLILYFLAGAEKAPLRATAGLAIGYGALVATHLPTALLFTPVLIVYAGYLARRRGWRVPVVAIAGAGFGGVAAAAYLLPATLYQPNIAIGLFWLDFSYAFSPRDLLGQSSDTGEVTEIGSPSFILLLHLSFLFVLYLIRVTWFAGKVQSPEVRAEYRFWMIACLVIFFLVTPLSAFLWDLLETFKRVQFAWRYHAVLCVAILPPCALAVEYAATLTPSKRRSFRNTMVGLNLGAVIIVAACIAHPLRFDDEEAAGRIAATSGLVEILPIAAIAGLKYGSNFDASLAGRYMKEWPRTEVASGAATVAVREWRPRHIRLDVNAQAGAGLVIGQLYYPGWKAVTGDGRVLDVAPGPNDPRMHLELPEGAYALNVVLVKGRAERDGEIATMVMIMLLFAAYLAGSARARRSHGKQNPT